jgi:hypothetical protein
LGIFHKFLLIQKINLKKVVLILHLFFLVEELKNLRIEKKSDPIGLEIYEIENSMNTQLKMLISKSGGEVNYEYETLTLNYQYDIFAGYSPLNRPGTRCYKVMLL